jgi:hypothetical protein
LAAVLGKDAIAQCRPVPEPDKAGILGGVVPKLDADERLVPVTFGTDGKRIGWTVGVELRE